MNDTTITLPRSVVEQALEALWLTDSEEGTEASERELLSIRALRAALKQPKRQPLTDEQILMALDAAEIPELPRDFRDVDIDIARAIERAHGIGGEA